MTGLKLALLALTGAGLAFIDEPIMLAAAIAGAFAIAAAIGVSPTTLLRALRPLVIPLALLILFHGLLDTWLVGVIASLRLTALAACAGVVSLSTPLPAMIETIERLLEPLRGFGVSPERVALSLALAVRFGPLMIQRARAMAEARRARGGQGDARALLIPLLIAAIRQAEQVAEAIDARGLDGEPPPRLERTP